ncbi:MAG: dephospho-CoA kinase [Lautropia sp.]|nr:dephospho-CoA kinase [Lautropia sp.]
MPPNIDSEAARLPLIGLTGGIGSGKSLVADLFVARGAALIDTDQIAHALTASGGRAIPAIREAFGDAVIAADGRMDRAVMRQRVFADLDQKQRLESILHPMILADAQAAIETARASGAPYALVAVPLLLETGHWVSRVDRVLVVDCPEAMQVQRVMQRSGLTAEQVEAIMAVQATREERLAAADDVIDNSGPVADTGMQVGRLHQQYLALGG